MDILEIVQNHLYQCIIKEKSFTSIAQHNIRNPTPLDPNIAPRILILSIGDHKFQCTNPSKWIFLCQYIRDYILSLNDGNTECIDTFSQRDIVSIELPDNICSINALQVLDRYISEIGDIPILEAGKEGSKVGVDPYTPVTLYTIKPYLYVRKLDAIWFRKEILVSDNSIEYDQIGIRNLLDTVETANFIGYEPFSVYLFMYMYPISVSLSITDREKLFGHRYFMLPIEGWNHPLRCVYSIPFLPQNEVDECTDLRYQEVRAVSKLFN
jgi:hypothetical protein